MNHIILMKMGEKLILAQREQVADSVMTEREMAHKLHDWLIKNVSQGFYDRLSRLVIAHKCEDEPNLDAALAQNSATRYLREKPF
jgi:hypothetical protein